MRIYGSRPLETHECGVGCRLMRLASRAYLGLSENAPGTQQPVEKRHSRLAGATEVTTHFCQLLYECRSLRPIQAVEKCDHLGTKFTQQRLLLMFQCSSTGDTASPIPGLAGLVTVLSLMHVKNPDSLERCNRMFWVRSAEIRGLEGEARDLRPALGLPRCGYCGRW